MPIIAILVHRTEIGLGCRDRATELSSGIAETIRPKWDMMQRSPDRDVEILAQAIALPPEERAAFIERVCGGDLALRRDVEVLLQAHAQAGNFLTQTPPLLALTKEYANTPYEKAGDEIGRYKLLQQIGEGGCGIVFMAEQLEPVHRRVALKVVKPGMDTRSVTARFEAERQALALMDHPNIAQVFDAGATQHGRPYFVMELVRGIKITDYCDQNYLSTSARLEVFMQVCDAVQHAHQKGVIHRDIKPSNILVTATADTKPLPKVIDFGIAKATAGQQLTDKTLFTAFEMLIGTPAYMSPEQATLASADIDTRTDIYSLGILLYELLTGSTPFDTKELLKSGVDEIRKVIREQEPLRPSTRLSRMTPADLTTVAACRNSEPPKLIRTVRGDLDWIVMKAVEKDRTRRYKTANALALDIQRFLSGEAISARPPSVLYKLEKLVLRNRLLFSGIAVIATLLVVSLIAVSASLAKAKADKEKAQIETGKSRQITQFLKNMLEGVGPSVALGRDTAMLRDILDRTAERVGQEMTNRPAVETELRSLIGKIYYEISNYEQAEQMQRRALAINRKLFGPQSAESAQSLDDLGLTLWRTDKPEAEADILEALGIRRKLFGNEHPDVATSLNHLADVYRHGGKPKQAEPLAQEALVVRQKCFGNESLEAAESLRILSILWGDLGRWPESEATARLVLAIRRKHFGPEHHVVAASLADVAWAASHQDKWGEVEALQRETLTMQRKLLGDGHRATIESLRNFCNTLERLGKHAEAEALRRESLNWWARNAGSEAPQTLDQVEWLARSLLDQKKFAESEKLLDKALTPDLLSQPSSAKLLTLQIDLFGRRGQWQEAASAAALAFKHRPTDKSLFGMLAALYLRSDNRAAYDQFCNTLLKTFARTSNIYVAEEVAKSCLFAPSPELDLQPVAQLANSAVEGVAPGHPAVPFFQGSKALSEYRQGHYAEAVEWAKKPLEKRGSYVHGHSYATLAMAYWRLGLKDEARTMLQKGEELAPAVIPEKIAGDPGNAWLAWLFARIQLDEATALIHSEKP